VEYSRKAEKFLYFFFFGLAFSGLASTSGCKSEGRKNERTSIPQGAVNSYCLGVVNGIVQTDIPAVVALSDDGVAVTCTGTFLSDNVVLTAAHCMDNSPTGGLGLIGGTMPNTMVHGGVVGINAPSVRPLADIALLIFPDATSTSWRKISSQPPEAGDLLTVVGYGQTDFINDNEVDGLVRYGFNFIDSVDQAQGTLKYDSPASTSNLAEGREAMSGRGDSGGPIISGDGLVAITSAGDYEANKLLEEDFYLFSLMALDVMEQAEAAGGHINGVNHIRKSLGKPLVDGALDTDNVPKNLPPCR